MNDQIGNILVVLIRTKGVVYVLTTSALFQDGYCRAANATPVVATLKGYVNVTSGDLQALKIAIAHFGPISVAIDASVRSFSFYANGVYYEPKCGKHRTPCISWLL